MIGSLSTKVDQAPMVERQRILLGCRFLFPAHIAEVAEDIRRACIDASVLGIVSEPSQQTIEASHAGQMKVARYLDQWPAPFSEVMTFRDVE